MKDVKAKKYNNYYSTYYAEYERDILRFDNFRFQKSYKLLENEKPGKLLGIGCLTGAELLPLQKKGWDCYGIELSDAYKIAVQMGVKCIKHDVSEGIPFDDENFNLVWIEEVIEHILDTDYLLYEINRVLVKRGILILSTPNLASLINRLKLLFGFLPRYIQYSSEGFGHVRYYTAGALNGQLERHGFRVEKLIGNFLSFPDPFHEKPIRKHILTPLGTLLPTLSENLIVRARKFEFQQVKK